MRFLLSTAIVIALAACGDVAQLPIVAGIGANPQLPPPNTVLIPTVNIAPAIGWPKNGKPLPALGLAVNAFAVGLEHPRWLYVLPNGDVLVAETNAPPRSGDSQGIKGWIMGWVIAKAGAGVPSANRITLLRDTDGDGVAETRTKFIEGLNSPFGMALIGDDFYVANTDAIVRFPYTDGVTQIAQPGTKVLDLPAGQINNHWTKNLLTSPDGSKLFVTVGSNSNVAENGMDQEVGRAAIWEVDLKGGSHRIFASGLRNPNGLAWEPVSGSLWTVVNERDEIGSDLVPDYLTSVADGSFFGWPYSYFGHHVDERVQPQRPDLVAKARIPDYALGSHTASLGLAFSQSKTWPAPFDNGFFIGQHGSWNRKPRSGYQVIFVPFKAGKAFGEPFNVLTGFVSADGDAFGRPVGVAMDKRAALLVADDVGNTIWRVMPITKRRH
ncbi:MAG: sorbosone dehydrogenase family protein [Methylococcaceae bacterium]|nr:sorbosone dehydrogenase family protein [Methylococcaceae bacterium]